MRRTMRKDVFIIHSKSRIEERMVAEFISDMLVRAGYSVYEYGDWDWESEETRLTYSWESGDQIDPVRDALGEPALQNTNIHREIDHDTLETMLANARLVVFVRPIRRRLSRGVQLETQIVRRQHGAGRSGEPVQRILDCSWDQAENPDYSTGKKAGVALEPFTGSLSQSPAAVTRVLRAVIEASSLLLTYAAEAKTRADHGPTPRMEAEVKRAHSILRVVREVAPIDPSYDLDSDMATLADLAARYHHINPSTDEIPLHPFIGAFRNAARKQLDNVQKCEALSSMPGGDVIAWRRAWVSVFCELCEPLYRFICLPDSEFNGFSLGYHRYLSDNEASVTCHFFERFCSETRMNHLLDSDVACFILSDCLAAFAFLVEQIGGQYIRESFQFHRLVCTRQLLGQVLFRQGGWPGGSEDRENVLKAFRQVPFPVSRYACMSRWTTVGIEGTGVNSNELCM